MAKRKPSKKPSAPPSPTGSDGPQRDARGRFQPGNAFGQGNPLGQQVQRLRAELVGAVRPADMRRIAAGLVDKARKGDLGAAKLLLAYTLGRPIEALESAAESIRRQHRGGRA